jgi:DNA repair ATPase RecN
MKMEATGTITKPEIQTELTSRQNSLEAQIDHLDRFITDLTSHKISLENANRQIEKMAAAEQDATKRAKYYTAIRSNIELLTKVFDSIAKLESIKHNYHKEIDDVIAGKIRLIAVDIRKIDEAIKGGDGDLVGFFEKLGTAMSNLGKGGNTPVKTVLTNDPEYKL